MMPNMPLEPPNGAHGNPRYFKELIKYIDSLDGHIQDLETRIFMLERHCMNIEKLDFSNAIFYDKEEEG